VRPDAHRYSGTGENSAAIVAYMVKREFSAQDGKTCGSPCCGQFRFPYEMDARRPIPRSTRDTEHDWRQDNRGRIALTLIAVGAGCTPDGARRRPSLIRRRPRIHFSRDTCAIAPARIQILHQQRSRTVVQPHRLEGPRIITMPRTGSS